MLTKAERLVLITANSTLLPLFSLVPGAMAAPFTAAYYFVPAVCPFFRLEGGCIERISLRQVFLFPMPGHGIFNSVQRTFPA